MLLPDEPLIEWSTPEAITKISNLLSNALNADTRHVEPVTTSSRSSSKSLTTGIPSRSTATDIPTFFQVNDDKDLARKKAVE